MKKLVITLVAVFGFAIVATGFAATQSASSVNNHSYVAGAVPPTGLFNAVTPPTGLFN